MAGLIGQNAMRERNSVEFGKSKSLEAIHKVPECRNDVCGSALCRPQYSLAAVPMPIESRLRTTFRFEALKSGSARVMAGGHGERYPMSSRQANLKAVASACDLYCVD